MEYLGGIDGMNFTPISNYNELLKNNQSFNVEPQGSEFENILNNKIQGGVERSNLDNFINPNDESASKEGVPGNFLSNVANSINGGLTSVNDKIKTANDAQEAFAMGEDVSVHDVMIASEKAQLSFQMATQLRNKLLNAYNELNNVKV